MICATGSCFRWGGQGRCLRAGGVPAKTSLSYEEIWRNCVLDRSDELSCRLSRICCWGSFKRYLGTGLTFETPWGYLGVYSAAKEGETRGKSSWVKRLVEPLGSSVAFELNVCLESHFPGPSPCLNVSFVGFQTNSESFQTFLTSVAATSLFFQHLRGGRGCSTFSPLLSHPLNISLYIYSDALLCCSTSNS